MELNAVIRQIWRNNWEVNYGDDGDIESFERNWNEETASLLDYVNKLYVYWRAYLLGKCKTFQIQSSGPFAGYTVLHVACFETKHGFISRFIEKYDINVMADDGAQPIHLACLFNAHKNFKLLLKHGANVNADFDKSLLLKYQHTYQEYWNEFGEKIPLIAFVITTVSDDLMDYMIDNNVNAEIKSLNNKTLLMYAIEWGWLGPWIAEYVKNREFINARDNDGHSAIDYIVLRKNYRNSQFSIHGQLVCCCECRTANFLIHNGADIYSIFNNNLITLPLNMAAYKCSPSVLKELLSGYEYLTNSRALYYSALALENPNSLICSKLLPHVHQWECLDGSITESIELILKDLVFRLTFRLFVPKKEKQLMEKLISMDSNIRQIVCDWKENFIEGAMKSSKIEYRDEAITFFDFAMKCCDRRQLRSVIRNQALMAEAKYFKKWYKFESSPDDKFLVNLSPSSYKLLGVIIRNGRKRLELLDKLIKVEQLRKAVPLPYELVLEIIEYLDNYDLEKFINTFFE